MDCREKFIQQISNRLLNDFEVEDVDKISTIICLCLENYDLSEKQTEVGFHDNTSEKLIQLFAGILLTEGKSKKTVRGYVYFLKKFFNEINMRLVDVSTMDIRIWLANKQQTLSLVTCENYRAYLSSFYSWLKNEDYISKNPIEKIKTIRYEEHQEDPFTDVDLDLLRANTDNARDRAIIEFLLASGVRVSELCEMNIEDVNFIDKSVWVRHGKGKKERKVFINDMCAYYLDQYLKTRTDNDTSLFVTKYNKKMSTDSVRKALSKIAEKAGIDNVHPHRFRKTFATKMHKKGMDLYTIQILMGHADIGTTTSIYIKNDLQRIGAEYNKYS